MDIGRNIINHMNMVKQLMWMINSIAYDVFLVMGSILGRYVYHIVMYIIYV